MNEYGMIDFLADMKFTDPNFSDCGCAPDCEPCEAHARFYRMTQFVEQLDRAGLDCCETANQLQHDIARMTTLALHDRDARDNLARENARLKLERDYLAECGSFGLTPDEARTEARLAADSQLAALNG